MGTYCQVITSKWIVCCELARRARGTKRTHPLQETKSQRVGHPKSSHCFKGVPPACEITIFALRARSAVFVRVVSRVIASIGVEIPALRVCCLLIYQRFIGRDEAAEGGGVEAGAKVVEAGLGIPFFAGEFVDIRRVGQVAFSLVASYRYVTPIVPMSACTNTPNDLQTRIPEEHIHDHI